jgi:hypothetical protein
VDGAFAVSSLAADSEEFHGVGFVSIWIQGEEMGRHETYRLHGGPVLFRPALGHVVRTGFLAYGKINGRCA